MIVKKLLSLYAGTVQPIYEAVGLAHSPYYYRSGAAGAHKADRCAICSKKPEGIRPMVHAV